MTTEQQVTPNKYTLEHEAVRTLVKSPPELWSECSDATAFARHLRDFGEIRITELEPESAVAWEGEYASGTVRIEPSGWGTRVTLTARTKAESVGEVADQPASGTPDVVPSPDRAEEGSDAPVEETLEEPDLAVEVTAGGLRRRWVRVVGRMRARFGPRVLEEPPVADEPHVRDEPHARDEPDVAVESPVAEEPAPEPSLDAAAILSAALDSLGQAHHRPFSRA